MKITDELLRQSARAAAQIYDRALTEPEGPVEFSPEFERGIRPLLPYKTRKRWKSWMSLAACVCVVCLFDLTDSGQAMLQGMFQRITTVYDDSAVVTYEPESEAEENAGVSSSASDEAVSVEQYDTTAESDEQQEKAVQPEKFVPKEPSELAEGLTLTDSYDDDYLRIREYTGADGQAVRFEQEYAGGTVYRYSPEGAEAETVTIGEDDQAYCVRQEDGTYTLVWIDGTSRMLLTGNLSKQALLDMANSVE